MIGVRRLDYAALLAIAFAADWAERLIALGGLAPRIAAAVASKRYAVDAYTVLVRLPRYAPDSWRTGLRARATRRPKHGIEIEETEEKGHVS